MHLLLTTIFGAVVDFRFDFEDRERFLAWDESHLTETMGGLWSSPTPIKLLAQCPVLKQSINNTSYRRKAMLACSEVSSLSNRRTGYYKVSVALSRRMFAS